METEEQILAERINILGEEFGLVFHLIYNHTLTLEYKWIEFEELYGKKQSRVDLLNYAAPVFFFIVQKILWENIILDIAKLTDPFEINGKKNLSIQSVPIFVNDSKLKDNLQTSINTILEQGSFCRDLRNKSIAHIDYALSINKNANKLEDANRLKVSSVLHELYKFINIIESHYFGTQTMFNLLFSDKGSLSLLNIIVDGVRERQRVESRLRNDEFDESDLRFSEI